MTTDRPIAAIVADLETELARLREMLAGRDATHLAVHPPNGKWSVLENLQHLTFTGLAHFTHFMPDHYDWSDLDLVQVEPRSAKQLRLRADGSIGDLLAAWRAGHEVIVARLVEHDTPAVRHRIARHLKHQRQHIDEIQRLIRRMDRPARGPG